MRWARRNASSCSCAKRAITSRSSSTARSQGYAIITKAKASNWAICGPPRSMRRTGNPLPVPWWSVRPQPLPTNGLGAFPIRLPFFASGWMLVRQRAKQRGVELPIIISDHCDWPELLDTINEVKPGEVWVTHGREEALVRWCELQGIAARPLQSGRLRRRGRIAHARLRRTARPSGAHPAAAMPRSS